MAANVSALVDATARGKRRAGGLWPVHLKKEEVRYPDAWRTWCGKIVELDPDRVPTDDPRVIRSKNQRRFITGSRPCATCTICIKAVCKDFMSRDD